MARFTLHVLRNEQIDFLSYDNMTSELSWADGSPVGDRASDLGSWYQAKPISPSNPGRKDNIRVLKISLGLSCNYSCSYCSQRFVPHADSTNPNDVGSFVASVLAAGIDPERIEFWGGEPLVYWKTLKPLAEKLREAFPNAAFGMITNGSLLDAEKNEWIDRMGFGVGISHDGPGYHVRGEDPLDNPEQRAAIMDLYSRLKPQGRISINAMVNSNNQSRLAIQDWLVERFGSDVVIGEGSFIDPYDAGGVSQLLETREEHFQYRTQSFNELRSGKLSNFMIANNKTFGFIQSIIESRPASSLGQKCGMDREDNIAVDLNGNVVSCQNVSAAASAPNGHSHLAGNLADLSAVELKTSKHWSQRQGCSKCPVLQLCKGSCMFLDGGLWGPACNSSFSDNLPFFATAIEILTGGSLLYIDGDIPEDRKDVFGYSSGIAEHLNKPAQKVIMMKAI